MIELHAGAGSRWFCVLIFKEHLPRAGCFPLFVLLDVGSAMGEIFKFVRAYPLLLVAALAGVILLMLVELARLASPKDSAAESFPCFSLRRPPLTFSIVKTTLAFVVA